MNLAHNSTGEFGSFEKSLRLHIYEQILRSGKIAKLAELADSFSMPEEEIRDGLQRLEQGHALVLHPGGEILRAAPFWAAPTLFSVECGKQSWWASCIWDALGVPAMLGKDARIVTSCGCCSDDMIVEVWNGAPRHREGVIHFAVPARRWYENVVFT